MSDDRRTCKVTVLLDRDDFERLDRYCSEFAFKKSTLIARLVKEYLSREGFDAEKSRTTSTRPTQSEG